MSDFAILYLTLLFTVVYSQSLSLCSPRSNFAASADGNKIVFAGGLYGSQNYQYVVDIYDSSNGSWISSYSLPTSAGRLGVAREFLAGAAAGGVIVFAGGRTGPNYINSSNEVDIYDTSRNQWTTSVNGAGRISAPRSRLVGAGTKTTVIFAGGFGVDNLVSRVVDFYDTVTKSFSSPSLLEFGRAFHAGAATGDTVVFAGGMDNASNPLASAEVYNVTSQTWNTTGGLGLARFQLAAAGVGTKIVFAGGSRAPGQYERAVDIYDIFNGWTYYPILLSEARLGLVGAAFMTNIVFGTGKTSSGFSNVLDIFDERMPLSGAWSTSQITRARTNAAAAATGGVLLIGGGTDGQYVDEVDAYPSLPTFPPTTTTGPITIVIGLSFPVVIQGNGVVNKNISIDATNDGAVPIVVSGTLTITSGSALEIVLQNSPASGEVKVAEAGYIEGTFSNVRVLVASVDKCARTRQTSTSLSILITENCMSSGQRKFAAWKIAVITISVMLGVGGVVAAVAILECYRRPREKVFHLIR